jgi:hypothetical protein
MPFHFCWDEAQAILMALPFVGAGVLCLRNYWHKLWHRNVSPKADGCCKKHDHD